MDLEEHLLSCLLRTKDIRTVIDARITSDYFDDDQHRRVFEFVQKHYTQYGEVPLAAHVRKNWPSYRLLKVDHGIDYYVTEIRKKYLHSELQLVLAEMTEQMDEYKDPQEALRIMQASIGSLSQIDSVMVDVDLSVTWEDRLTEYEEFRENKGQLRGISTGFPTLDRATLGLQPEQFIVFVGLPKSGKSTLLLVVGVNAHTAGKRVLLIGFEMSNQEQGARYDAVTAKVDHLRLLSGEIGTKDVQALERQGKLREELAEFISSTDIASATTVSGIRSKIQQYEPDLVLVDGLYLMDDEYGEPKGSSAALTNISRGLKRCAQLEKVPIVGTTQALHSKVSRSLGLTMNSIGYTSAFAQDANLVVGVEAASEEDPTIQRLKSLANRIGPSVEFEVEWDWSVGTFQEIDDDAGIAVT